MYPHLLSFVGERKKNKCRILRRSFFFCAYQIITHINSFFDIFHGLKEIASSCTVIISKKDKPDTVISVTVSGLSLFFKLFFLTSLFPVKKLLSTTSKVFPFKKRYFRCSRFFLSAFLKRADRFIQHAEPFLFFLIGIL